MGRNKKYPIEQEVTCAVCGKSGIRKVTAYMQQQNLWYCCPGCKAARRKLVLQKKLPVSPVWEKRKKEKRAKKKLEDIKNIAVSSRSSMPRKSLDDIPTSSDYESKLWSH